MQNLANEKRIALLGVAVSVAMVAARALAGETTNFEHVYIAQATDPTQPSGIRPVVKSEGGLLIHVDPRTGAILKEPAPGSVPLLVSPQFLNSISTSHQGLVEALSSVPGGGVKLDLQGRFQSPLIATVDAEGKVKIQHLEPPGAQEKK
jgi:hypothetical protein